MEGSFPAPKGSLESHNHIITQSFKIMIDEKDNPFKLTAKDRLIEIIGIVLFLLVFIGSAVKLLFL